MPMTPWVQERAYLYRDRNMYEHVHAKQMDIKDMISQNDPRRSQRDDPKMIPKMIPPNGSKVYPVGIHQY